MGRCDDAGVKGVDGHVTVGRRGRKAWHVIAPERVSFQSAAQTEAAIRAASVRLARLEGREFHERVTTVPYPADRWAADLHKSVADPLPGWAAHLDAEQRHMRGMSLSGKLTMLGVEVETSPHRAGAYRAEVEHVAAVLDGGTGAARPATPAEMRFLTARSHTLGAPPEADPGPARPMWTEGDLAAYTEMADWTAEPGDAHLTVVSHVDGKKYTRFVSVMTLEWFDEVDIPGNLGPWMYLADALPFPVEWSRVGRFPDQSKVSGRLTLTMQKIVSQAAHWAEDHGMPVPVQLAGQRDLAERILGEVASGKSGKMRLDAWVRAAVSAPTLPELEARREAFQMVYRPKLLFSAGLSRSTRAGLSQYRRAVEFIPGAPLADTAHKRGMSLDKWNGAIPAAEARVGDRSGFYLGATSGTSRRPAFWAPWAGMEERNQSGLAIVAGVPGVGKSTLIAALAYNTCLAGRAGIVLDPGGPLAEIAGVPGLAGRARAVDLMEAPPGALSPYRVIAEPLRSNYADDAAWRQACGFAALKRQRLCIDILTGLLPESVAGSMATRFVLKDAVRRAGGHWATDAGQVVAHVQQSGKPGQGRALKNRGGAAPVSREEYREHARYLAHELEDAMRLPQCQLIFGRPAVAGRQSFGDGRDLLQILTMRGNTVPKDGKPRAEWSDEERIGHSLHALATFYAVNWVYTMPMGERKLAAIDEAQVMADVDTGRATIRTLAHDSRKWNLRLVLSSPEPELAAACGVTNRIGDVFVGRCKSAAAVAEALRLLEVDAGAGFEKRVASLPARTFVWQDGHGGCEAVKIHRPDALARAADTTPAPAKELARS